jgi:thiol-disulfide isomerase/thioredoxin
MLFVAPWCGHCTKFAPTYEEVGRILHEQTSTQKRPVKVAKINGDKEKSIRNRFQITGFPTFYVIDGWDVYLYDGSRAVSDMVDFAKGGYKQKAEVGWMLK